jgi:hypothetical protein
MFSTACFFHRVSLLASRSLTRNESKPRLAEDVTLHKDLYQQALDMKSEIDQDPLAKLKSKLKGFLSVSHTLMLFRTNAWHPNHRPLSSTAL